MEIAFCLRSNFRETTMFRKSLVLAISCVMLVVGTSVNAAAILFGRVGTGSYVADGQDLVNYLVTGGNTVDYVNLETTVISDFSSYSQVWVYDLVTGLNNSATQMANYTNIANWYNGLTNQNLIADGRIVSSSERWTDRPNGLGTGGEPEWIQNYATQLDLRGGGLVLGTDHAGLGTDTGAFVDGINTINDLIGIGRFNDAYYPPLGWNSSPGDPLDAVVDVNSPLHIGALEPCSFNGSLDCINDNSSTSFVPTGLQGNGQTLTPVAYHGDTLDAWDFAAVSATMGSSTFGTCGNPGQPPCDVPEPSIIALFAAGLFGLGFARRRMRS